MRRQIIALLAFGALVLTALPALAAAPLKWSQETTRLACDGTGAPVINVTQHVTGDIDSGFNGGWAVDTYTRRIQVWELSEGEYCAVVRYAGTFEAIAGANSPGQGSLATLDGDEKGNLQGGYRAIITGEMVADPAWRTRGTVGRFDYECSSLSVCPGAVDWVEQYFGTGHEFQYEFWGWVYRAGRHGTWVNASTGSTGDIG